MDEIYGCYLDYGKSDLIFMWIIIVKMKLIIVKVTYEATINIQEF